MADLTTFRDTIRQISPWWLRGTIGERILYSIAITLDVLGDSLNYAIRARFLPPSDEGAIEASGRERKIPRGHNELTEGYAARLLRWLDSHAKRGGPYGVLEQLREMWLPVIFNAEIVYYTGRRFSMDLFGEVTYDDISWLPDPIQDWARWWLMIEWPTALGPDTAWDTPGDWDDGGLWNIAIADLNAADADDLRLVAHEWNSAHCISEVWLRAGGVEFWDYPEGTWDDPGVWMTDAGGYVKLKT